MIVSLFAACLIVARLVFTTLLDLLVQRADSRQVKLVSEVAAGNHSVWAARQLLAKDTTEVREEDLRFRKGIFFKNSDLTPHLRLILSGALSKWDSTSTWADAVNSLFTGPRCHQPVHRSTLSTACSQRAVVDCMITDRLCH